MDEHPVPLSGSVHRPTGDDRQNRLRGHPWLTLAVLSTGAMMVSLDSMVVIVAQPEMQAELSASFTQMQWVTAGYLLAVATLLIGAGKIGDRFGHRSMFLIGVAGFSLTSAAIGFSREVTWLIGFRVLQGVFGAVMQPATLALLRTVFAPERLTMPIAIRSGVLAMSVAGGPVIGGLLVTHLNWQSVFFVNVPIGVVTIAMATLVLRDARPGADRQPFDALGLLLLSAALLVTTWAVIRVPEAGLGSTETVGCFLAGAVLGGLFLVREKHAADPLVPLSLFRSATFSVGVALMSINSFVLFGVPFLLSFYLQNVLQLSPLRVGLQVLWLTAVMVVGAPISAMIMKRVGERVPVVVGMALTAVAVLGFTGIGADTAIDQLTGWFVLLGLGFSPVIIGATRLIISSAPLRLAGVASGLQQTAMQVGGSIGTAALGALVAARIGTLLPDRLAEAGITLSGPIEEAVESVSTGRTPAGAAGAPAAAHWVTATTFLDGTDIAFVVTSVLALGGAVIGLFGRPRAAGTAQPQPATDTAPAASGAEG